MVSAVRPSDLVPLQSGTCMTLLYSFNRFGLSLWVLPLKTMVPFILVRLRLSSVLGSLSGLCLLALQMLVVTAWSIPLLVYLKNLLMFTATMGTRNSEFVAVWTIPGPSTLM